MAFGAPAHYVTLSDSPKAAVAVPAACEHRHISLLAGGFRADSWTCCHAHRWSHDTSMEARHHAPQHRCSLRQATRRPHVLLGVTGSVAAIKVPQLAAALREFADVRVVATPAAKHFFTEQQLPPECRPLLGGCRKGTQPSVRRRSHACG